MNYILILLLCFSNSEVRDTAKSRQRFSYTYDKSVKVYFLINEQYTGKSYLGGNHPMYYECPVNAGIVVSEEDLIKANAKPSDLKGYSFCL